MRKQPSKAEILSLVSLQSRLEKLRDKMEKNDIQLNYGNGLASEQISCAVASIECILQEVDFDKL